MPWVRAGLTRVVRRAIRKRCLRQTRLSVERSAAGCWTGTRSLLHEMRWTVAKMRPHWLRVRRRKPGSAVGDYLPSGLVLQRGSARCYGECEGECAPVTRLALDTYTTAVESASVRKRTSLYAGNPRSNDVPTSRSRECSRQARVHVPHRLAGPRPASRPTSRQRWGIPEIVRDDTQHLVACACRTLRRAVEPRVVDRERCSPRQLRRGEESSSRDFQSDARPLLRHLPCSIERWQECGSSPPAAVGQWRSVHMVSRADP